MSVPITKRNPERAALLRAEYPTSTDANDMLARINSLPGAPIASVAALNIWAASLGLRKTPETLVAIRLRAQTAGGKSRAREASDTVAGRPRLRSPERVALFLERYPIDGASTALVEALNALPGAKIRSVETLKDWRHALGLRMDPAHKAERRRRGPEANRAKAQKVRAERAAATPLAAAQRGAIASFDMTVPRRVFAAVPPPPPPARVLAPDEQAARADAVFAARYERARRLIAAKKDPFIIAASCRLHLREVFRLQGENRMGIG